LPRPLPAIFDSLRHAVAHTLHAQRKLDGAQASASLARWLADTGVERLRRIAAMALGGKDE
jgi:hypothetical protein